MPPREGREADGERSRGVGRWAAVVLGLALVACLALCGLTGLGLAFRGRTQRGPLWWGSGGIMGVCVGMVTQPYVRAGIGWEAAIMSVSPPPVFASPYAICFDVPQWPARLPLRGEWMFPP